MTQKRKLKNNCDKATFLVEKQSCTSLSITEYFFKNIHMAGCPSCRIYQRQSRIIDSVVRKKLNEEPPALETDAAFLARLHNKMDEAMNNFSQN